MKKSLSVLSSYGSWGVELSGPMVKPDEAYELIFATPKGARPIALPPRYDESIAIRVPGKGRSIAILNE